MHIRELEVQRVRLRIVADEIERAGTLDMSTTWQHGTPIPCGTPGCIAGYTVRESVRNQDGDLPDEVDAPLFQVAAAWLLLTDQQARNLFMPETPHAYWNALPGYPRHITLAMAVDTLRRFADTGTIEWRENAALA